jgi:hypothetical protein
MPKPFRWSIVRREQLGTLAGAPQPPEPWFLDELRETAARVLAFADNADLAFIGRTPENFYDYLSGAFEGWNEAPRLHLVHFSLRWVRADDTTTLQAANIAALAAYFDEEGVDPASIAAGGRPLALVDLIVDGGTMKNLVHILRTIAQNRRVDWNAVQRRLRIVGLTHRTHNSPNTWRWQQHQDWLDLIGDAEIKNVSASHAFLHHIGDDQAKVTQAFHAGRWQTAETGAPETTPDQRTAIAHAAYLYDLGRTRAERHALAARIARLPEMRKTATRALVAALRRR